MQNKKNTTHTLTGSAGITSGIGGTTSFTNTTNPAYTYPGVPMSSEDQLFKFILEQLRLATYISFESMPDQYLRELAQRIKARFENDLDAWKKLLTGEEKNTCESEASP